jgi:hypothetical protein
MTDKIAALVYPHQLWEANPAVSKSQTVIHFISLSLTFTVKSSYCIALR